MFRGLWRTAEVDAVRAEQLADRWKVPIRVARWLAAREVAEEEIEAWFEPRKESWTDPHLFSDMRTAVDRIRLAIEGQERICVVGDYDVDGVTASAILCTGLQALGVPWDCLIPHRIEDGYGLSTRIIDVAAEAGCKLIVTVDNGIAAVEQVAYAVEHGLDVIITDHHEPGGDSLPDAVAIVHWIRSTHEGLSRLSGAGVAWKLMGALLESFAPADLPIDTAAFAELNRWHLGLAALGALADMVPLRGENRRLIHEGLAALKSCSRPGWIALCSVAGENPKTLTDGRINWKITPRLNAAGRMDSADVAFRLLMAEDTVAAREQAALVEGLNRSRREETDRATREALDACQRMFGSEPPPIIVLSGPWLLGVVGIVAAKLVSEWQRPVIVLSDDGDDLLRGSGRSLPGVPLYHSVSSVAHLLEKFGGHDAAIGCTIHRSQLPDFQRMLQETCERASETSALMEEVVSDDYLPLGGVNLELAQWVERFGPFGQGNPPLTFYIGPVIMEEGTPFGDGKYLKLRVREGDDVQELTWFQPTPDAFSWHKGTTLSAVVTVDRDEWRGKERVRLLVRQAHRLINPLSRAEFGQIYRLLRARRRLPANDWEALTIERTQDETKVMFDTFVELGFAHLRESEYHVVEQVVPRDLRDSISYQRHLRDVSDAPA